MRWYVSPTTSIAKAPSWETASPRPAREAAVTFETLLLQEALRPLARSMGVYGDAVLGACANAIARHDRGAWMDRLESIFRGAFR